VTAAPVPLQPHAFTHGPVSLDVLAAPDLDALVGEGTDPERIPYWSVLWESAYTLARRLVEQDGWEGTPVLELGCGAGLTGLALAARGARVTQTDLFPEAVSLARQNAARNGLKVRHAAADWHAWPLAGAWPVVLGSDLTYERVSHRPLLDVLRLALAPGGTAYVADPGRPMSLDFFALAEAEGWGVEMEPAPDAPVWLYTLRR